MDAARGIRRRIVAPPTSKLVTPRQTAKFWRPRDFGGNNGALGVVGEGWPKRGVGLRAEIIRVRIENAGLDIALGPEIHPCHGGPLADGPIVDVIARDVAGLAWTEGQIDEIAG